MGVKLARLSHAAGRLPRPGRDWRRAIRPLLLTLLILPGAAFVLFPFWWMIATSLKDPRYIWLIPPQWFPNPIRWANYAEAIQQQPLLLQARNTTFITLANIVGSLLTTIPVAYGFARLRFVGRDLLFLVLLATMMLPSQVTLIPVFILFTKLQLMNSYWPLILPTYLGANPFLVFMVRQFIMGIPRDLDDAARIDGAGSLRICRDIIVPLIKPALALVTIFTFYGNWNDFLWPLLVLNDDRLFTLSLGLQQFVRAEQHGGIDYNLMMAYAMIVAIPCIVIFFVTQRQLMRGVVLHVSVG